ncbi:MAG: hypothetical protein JWP35_572 [Caulobacter sp.]|nr:hypothetical protein [Caulobacter sp.]
MLDRRNLLGSVAAVGMGLAAGDALGAGKRKAVSHAAGGNVKGLKALLDKTTNALLTEYPDDATFLGLDTGARAALHGKLTDRSIAADNARAASCAARLKELKAFDAKGLSGIDAINLETTIYGHELAEEGYRAFHYGDNAVLNVWQAESNTPYAVSQGTGWFAVIPDFLDSQHKIETVADAEAYLSRLSAMAKGLDDENSRMKRDAALGVIAPDYILDTTLKQQTGYRANPIGQWGLVASIAGRTAKLGLAGDWKARAQKICEAEIAPALDRQIAVLKDLRAKATHDAGVWKLPNGDAYYRWLLKVGTTTPMTPEEVHQLGLAQVASITADMDAILKKQGFSQGSVGERMTALGKDPRFLFPNTDAGRAELLDYLNGVIAKIRARLPRAFATLHRADLVIKRVPVDIEAGAPSGYEQDGPIDGSRPASYYINLRDTANWPKFSLPTLCFHEGIPGHVLQGTYVHQLPEIRSQLMFNAYVEGWALYAEQLGDELGMYDDDPVGRLGYLQSIQFRACRLVVDTGMHAKRWTREQAIKYMVDNNGDSVDDATSEIDRYCAWPGQACGYQVGHLEIVRLRDKAKAALGPKFDLRTFNDAVVTSGSLPLTLLGRVIDGYIARQKG